MGAAPQRTQAGRSHMTIGDVLGRLRGEFPDITVSKIRFLESEGLIELDRTPSGYRKFTLRDVERLRFILAAQRDRYLPLRVIKEQLETGEQAPRVPRTLVAADSASSAEVRLTRRQLMDGAGVSEALREELEADGLVRRSGSAYDGEAMAV
ncbi:MAG: MerR family transcriptional regulator, partial [Streptosporangiaceae bacterium]